MSVPPWVQLVGLPLVVFFGWLFATAASHAVVVFLIATLISLLLNPVVRMIASAGVPRPLAVLLVFSAFSVIIATFSVAVVDTVATEAGRVRSNLPEYSTRIEHKVDDIQKFVDRRGIEVNLRDEGLNFLGQLEKKSTELSTRALDFGRDFVRRLAEAIFNVVLVVVITIYMLLDAPRISRFVSSVFPRGSNIEVLSQRLEHSLFRYIVGQTLASGVMGISATVGLWLIGITGIWSGATDLAIIFGLIVAVTEFAPSIGPVLGSIPPIIAASFDGIGPAVAVLIFFIILHQLEGHIVIPKLMGAAIAVHPLAVIFGIVAGAQIFGPGGLLLALPMLAAGREIVLFVRERVVLGEWPSTVLPAAVGAASPVARAVVIDAPDAPATAPATTPNDAPSENIYGRARARVREALDRRGSRRRP